MQIPQTDWERVIDVSQHHWIDSDGEHHHLNHHGTRYNDGVFRCH